MRFARVSWALIFTDTSSKFKMTATLINTLKIKFPTIQLHKHTRCLQSAPTSKSALRGIPHRWNSDGPLIAQSHIWTNKPNSTIAMHPLRRLQHPQHDLSTVMSQPQFTCATINRFILYTGLESRTHKNNFLWLCIIRQLTEKFINENHILGIFFVLLTRKLWIKTTLYQQWNLIWLNVRYTQDCVLTFCPNVVIAVTLRDCERYLWEMPRSFSNSSVSNNEILFANVSKSHGLI